MDPRIKEILSKNDHKYRDFRNEVSISPMYADDIYKFLHEEFGVERGTIPLASNLDLKKFYTDVIDTIEEDRGNRNQYLFEYDNEGEIIGVPGIQRMFELAQAMGDSDERFQVRYMFITFNNRKGLTLPSKVYTLKMGQSLEEDVQNKYVQLMHSIADTQPTKILLFRLIKPRS